MESFIVLYKEMNLYSPSWQELLVNEGVQYLNLTGLRGGDIQKTFITYTTSMYAFVKAFVIFLLCKTNLSCQSLSSLLTPSDEAFLQLCVRVYCPSTVANCLNMVCEIIWYNYQNFYW